MNVERLCSDKQELGNGKRQEVVERYDHLRAEGTWHTEK